MNSTDSTLYTFSWQKFSEKKVSIPTQVTNNSRGSIKIPSTLPPCSSLAKNFDSTFNHVPLKTRNLRLKRPKKKISVEILRHRLSLSKYNQDFQSNQSHLIPFLFSPDKFFTLFSRQSSFIKDKNERLKARGSRRMDLYKVGRKVCSWLS